MRASYLHGESEDGMLIRSQDRKKLFPMDTKPIGATNEGDFFYICGVEGDKEVLLGKYTTEKRTMEVLDEIQEVYEACESMRYTSAGLTAPGVTYGNAFTDNIDVIMEAVKNYTNEISRALVFQMPADPEAEKI